MKTLIFTVLMLFSMTGFAYDHYSHYNSYDNDFDGRMSFSVGVGGYPGSYAVYGGDYPRYYNDGYTGYYRNDYGNYDYTGNEYDY